MFTWNPHDYASHSAGQMRWAHELLGKLQLRGSEAVLDVGCGDGKITAQIAAHVPAGRVVGIDASREMIDFAGAHFCGEAHANLAFHCMDAAAIKLGETFDLVFSNAALHWVPDQRAALLGMAETMRPGSRLIISCGGRDCADEVLATVRTLMKRSPWQPFFKGFDFHYYFKGPEDYAPWLAEAGLHAERLELVPKDMVHEGRAGLLGWLRTTWHPFAAQVPEAQREAFFTEFADLYLQTHPLDAQGRAHVAMVRLEVDATRRKIE